MTNVEAETLFEILDLLKSIKNSLERIEKRMVLTNGKVCESR